MYTKAVKPCEYEYYLSGLQYLPTLNYPIWILQTNHSAYLTEDFLGDKVDAAMLRP